MNSAPLARRLGLGDAVFIGLGSMIGAGVFSAFAPAAASAGTGLLIGLVVAAIVAWCNASSSAQLAAQYPMSGGTYVYGREELGPWWGFAAGWSFVIGKTASCAAMALTFAAYAAPAGWEKPVAALAVLALAVVNYFGVTRTAFLTRILVVITLLVLAIAVVATGLNQGGEPPDITELSAVAGSTPGGWFAYVPLSSAVFVPSATPYGVLQAAGLLFFAFAGYARIATMGEEVRDPGKTIPRAITIALGLVVVVYLAVAVRLLGTLPLPLLAASTSPIADALAFVGQSWAVPIVTIGASAASLGALLALFTGIGRTALAMARERDLPRVLAAVHPRYHVPHRAEIVLAVVVCALVLTVDLRGAIAFSSFGVLLYYFIANLSAFAQTRTARRALIADGSGRGAASGARLGGAVAAGAASAVNGDADGAVEPRGSAARGDAEGDEDARRSAANSDGAADAQGPAASGEMVADVGDSATRGEPTGTAGESGSPANGEHGGGSSGAETRLAPAFARRRSRYGVAVVGMLGCLTLVVTLPWQGVVAGVAVLAIGALGRLLFLRAR